MAIIVERGSGDRPGEAIVDSMLVDLPTKLARGTYEINESSDKLIVTTQLVKNEFIEHGTMISIAYKGKTLIGRVTGFSLSAGTSGGKVQDKINCIAEVPYGQNS